MDHRECTEEPPKIERPLPAVISKSNTSNLRAPESSPPPKGVQSQGPSPPGVAPPPAFASPLFYETARSVQLPQSRQTSLSSGGTRGASSSSEVSRQLDDLSSPLTTMSSSNVTGEEDPFSRVPDHIDTSASGSFRPAPAAPLRQAFPAQSFYHSGPVPPPVPPAPPYGQQPPPGPGFIGQYMTPQQSHPLRSPVQFGYSHSFAHPGIHAQDASVLGMPFGPAPQPQHNSGYAYPHGPSSEPHAGGPGRSTPGYVGPASPDGTGGPRLPESAQPTTTMSHMSHHAYPLLHYSAASTGPRYPHYSTHSFAHSTPNPYTFGTHPPGTYSHSFYGQPPPPSEAPSKVGTWWYMPSSGTQHYDSSAYHPAYHMQGYQPSTRMGRPDFDPYGSQAQVGQSSSHSFVDSSRQQLQSPHGAGPAREPPFLPSSPVSAHTTSPGPDPLRPNPPSPIPKKRSPMSPSPPPSRRSYHPNPPSNRSDWVMWVGNVPSDATHDELWRFFNQPAPPPASLPGTTSIHTSRQGRSVHSDNEGELWGRVASIFLISRSNCAFVNFDTEQRLMGAVKHFNGKPLRPKDSRCARMVCRVRRKDDDLRAGVGGQRGIGLHTRWVMERKERELQKKKAEDEGEGGEDVGSSGEGPPNSPSTHFTLSNPSDPSPPILVGSPTEDAAPIPPSQQSPRDSGPRQGSSGNQSFTSTNSSFLASNFPKRYFILKSLTQYDLNLSLDRGIWATQPHNEEILDQAYRTSKDVYLIFGANKSGEFFGYARMAGPIFHNERVDHVSWASRSSASTASARGGSIPPEAIKEEDETDHGLFLSPTERRLVDESPAPVTPGEKVRLKLKTSTKDAPASNSNEKIPTAPPELHHPHKALSHAESPREAGTLPEPRGRATLIDAPHRTFSENIRAPMNPNALDSANFQRNPTRKLPVPIKDADGVLRKDTWVTPGKFSQRGKDVTDVNASNRPKSSRPNQEDQNEKLPVESKPEGWGREFNIEWLRSERLPFYRTRHLRNPWNHDREVKVSRDGTELEPGVGQQLLDEWDKPPLVEPDPSPPTSPASRGRGSKAPSRPAGATADIPMRPTSSSSQIYHSSSSGGIGQGRGRGASQS